MKNELRILIADDHPIFRNGLRQIIETDLNLKVVAEAADGLIAMAKLAELKPDCAVLDIHMPNLGGFDIVRAMREKRLTTEVIFLTMYKDEEIFNTAMDLGVKGYVLKDSAITEIIDCIKMVAN